MDDWKCKGRVEWKCECTKDDVKEQREVGGLEREVEVLGKEYQRVRMKKKRR